MWNLSARRGAEVVIATVGLVVLSPAILFAGAAMRITTRQSAFFKQTRFGLNGDPFTIYKLRTMKDAYGTDGNPLPDIERVTRLGIFLRSHSIDEAPQLWNILKGDMSLVGPRPLVEKYNIPNWEDRYVVAPGLYGLSQYRAKKAHRKMSAAEMLRTDKEYIEQRENGHWLYLDVKILLRSAWLSLTGRSDVKTEVKRPPQPISICSPDTDNNRHDFI